MALDLYVDAALYFHLYLAVGNGGFHVLANLFDISAKVHAFDVVVAVEPFVGTRYGGDAPRCFLELVHGFLATRIAGLVLQQAGDNSQAVFHPVVHFLYEELLTFERRFEVVLSALALNGHAKEFAPPCRNARSCSTD